MSRTALTFKGRVICVTGARTFLGNALIRLLEDDDRYDRIIALDIVEPDALDRAEFSRIDLLSPDAEDTLADLCATAGVDTVVHAAFLSHPTHALAWAHELEDVGTMQVLGACEATNPARVILASSTLVYGAHRDNPNRIREDHALELTGQPPFLADKIRAEQQLAQHAAANPAASVASLRFAPIIGPTARNFITELLARPIVPRMMGHDPLIQLTHESDAAHAFKRAVDVGPRGPINIASRGVLPISTALALLGRLPLPIPGPLLRPLAALLWTTQLAGTPAAMTDFLRYLCVADTTRAVEVLDFRARHHIRDVLEAHYGEPADSDHDYDYADAVG